MNNSQTVLVTGGSGFVGMQIILQLLQKGYRVRTTLRDLSKKDQLLQTLKLNGITSFSNLSFAEAELTDDQNWKEVMSGCSCVMSVASPVFFDKPKDKNEAIRPAVEGILRMLQFAKESGVKRVVMTSNFGAVGFTQRDKTRQTTEADWTDPEAEGLSLYEKSKTLAEKAAWEFIHKNGEGLELTTINPVAILGPSLDAHVSGSFILLKMLLHGTLKAVPNLPLNVVDVRDVADLHIRAMESPNAKNQRFIATADGQTSLIEIGQLIINKRPLLAKKIPKRRIPNWVLNIAAIFNEQAKEGLFMSKMNRNVSNEKARKLLSWKPIATGEETILASVDSMIKYNLTNKPN